MNKIIFLGTGAATHLTRQMTSILLVVNGHGILLDCGDGMGTIRQIIKSGTPLSIIGDVLITHKHADHIMGMPQFLFLKMLENKESKVRIFGPRQALKAVKYISVLTHDFLLAHHHRIAYIPMSPKKEYKIAPSIVVTAAKMQHGSLEAMAYKIIVGNSKIVFTGDAAPSKSLYKLAQGVDILIHECFGIDKDRNQIHTGHSTALDAGKLAQLSGVKSLYLTHLPKENMTKPETIKREAGKYYQGQIHIAEDLMEIILN